MSVDSVECCWCFSVAHACLICLLLYVIVVCDMTHASLPTPWQYVQLQISRLVFMFQYRHSNICMLFVLCCRFTMLLTYPLAANPQMHILYLLRHFVPESATLAGSTIMNTLLPRDLYVFFRSFNNNLLTFQLLSKLKPPASALDVAGKTPAVSAPPPLTKPRGCRSLKSLWFHAFT